MPLARTCHGCLRVLPVLLALGRRGTVRLRSVLQVALLHISSAYRLRERHRNQGTYAVPGASTTVVGALVASELVDHHPSITVVVPGTSAAAGLAARGGRRAVSLVDILQSTTLKIVETIRSVCVNHR